MAKNDYMKYDANSLEYTKESEFLTDKDIRTAFQGENTMLTFEKGTKDLEIAFINKEQRVLSDSDMAFNIHVFQLDDKQMETLVKYAENTGSLEMIFELIFHAILIGCGLTVMFAVFFQVVLNEDQREELKAKFRNIFHEVKPLLKNDNSNLTSYREVTEEMNEL
jgi:hypothetical protein